MSHTDESRRRLTRLLITDNSHSLAMEGTEAVLCGQGILRGSDGTVLIHCYDDRASRLA